MSDRFTPEQRSDIMSRIKGRNTAPERTVRSLLHRMGYRFRLHRKGLPGNPDIVLPKYMVVIFVHGCFWHGHTDCNRAKRPTSNVEFWNNKLQRNVERDRSVRQELEDLGWHVEVIWQCEIRDIPQLESRLRSLFYRISTSTTVQESQRANDVAGAFDQS